MIIHTTQVLFKIFIFSTLLLLFNVSISNENDENFDTPNQQIKSPTEIEAIQSRVYEYEYKEVYRSVLSVLQDNHFEIKFTDFQTGVISADGDELSSGNENEVMAAQAAGAAAGSVLPFAGLITNVLPFLSENEQVKYSIATNIEEIKNSKVKVRLVITAKVSGKKGFEKYTKTKDMTEYPEFYQNLFSKIDGKLFLRSNLE